MQLWCWAGCEDVRECKIRIARKRWCRGRWHHPLALVIIAITALLREQKVPLGTRKWLRWTWVSWPPRNLSLLSIYEICELRTKLEKALPDTVIVLMYKGGTKKKKKRKEKIRMHYILLLKCNGTWLADICCSVNLLYRWICPCVVVVMPYPSMLLLGCFAFPSHWKKLAGQGGKCLVRISYILILYQPWKKEADRQTVFALCLFSSGSLCRAEIVAHGLKRTCTLSPNALSIQSGRKGAFVQVFGMKISAKSVHAKYQMPNGTVLNCSANYG